MNRSTTRNEGVALLTALALLFVFSILGVAYVGYAMNALERTNYQTQGVRARHAALGGIEAAIGSIALALPSGDVSGVLSAPIEFEFPFYQFDRLATDRMAPVADRRWAVRVTVTDESGKINLNFAPTRVLQAVLGIDGDAARKIRSSLPLDSAAGNWLTGLDDLVTRGLISQAAFAAIPKDLVTVYTVPDPAHPAEFLNVNAASVPVLAAILDVTPEVAQQAAQKRSFNNVAELAAAAGKDVAAFNFKPAPDAQAALPRDLCLRSRCFRIRSESELVFSEGGKVGRRTARSYAEAVVVFGETGAPHVTYWSEAPRPDAGTK